MLPLLDCLQYEKTVISILESNMTLSLYFFTTFRVFPRSRRLLELKNPMWFLIAHFLFSFLSIPDCASLAPPPPDHPVGLDWMQLRFPAVVVRRVKAGKPRRRRLPPDNRGSCSLTFPCSLGRSDLRETEHSEEINSGVWLSDFPMIFRPLWPTAAVYNSPRPPYYLIVYDRRGIRLNRSSTFQIDNRDLCAWLNTPRRHPFTFLFLWFRCCVQKMRRRRWLVMHSGRTLTLFSVTPCSWLCRAVCMSLLGESEHSWKFFLNTDVYLNVRFGGIWWLLEKDIIYQSSLFPRLAFHVMRETHPNLSFQFLAKPLRTAYLYVITPSRIVWRSECEKVSFRHQMKVKVRE